MGSEMCIRDSGSGAEVEGAVGDDAGGVVAVTSIGGVVGVATGEGVGEGTGEVSCSSMAIVAYTCFLCADGTTTVVGQCGGGVGILRVVADLCCWSRRRRSGVHDYYWRSWCNLMCS